MNSSCRFMFLLISSVCCVNVFPSLNYTTFENSTSLFTFSCSGVGTFLFWIVDGNVSTSPTILQRGIQTIPLLPSGGYVYSLLSIPTNMENNNSEVVCKVFDYTGTDVQYSHQLYLRLQGPLDAPYAFGVNLTNTTLILSWGAPFSLNVTDYFPDIFYYTLCANVTIFGCRTIPSDLDCTFPSTCTYLVTVTDTTNGHYKTLMNGNPIEFTLFAVNGAGSGMAATTTYKYPGLVSQNASETTVPVVTPVMTTNASTILGTTDIILIIACTIPGSGAIVIICLVAIGTVTCMFLCGHSRRRKGHAATENTQSSYMSYQVNNIMAIPVIDNMEPCPAYAQIHMHIYDLEDSHGQVP